MSIMVFKPQPSRALDGSSMWDAANWSTVAGSTSTAVLPTMYQPSSGTTRFFWIAVRLVAETAYTISYGGMDSNITLYDESGTQLAYGGWVEYEVQYLTYTPTVTGIYYLKACDDDWYDGKYVSIPFNTAPEDAGLTTTATSSGFDAHGMPIRLHSVSDAGLVVEPAPVVLTGTVVYTNRGGYGGSITLNSVTQSISGDGTVTFSDVPAGTYTPTYTGYESTNTGESPVTVTAGETTNAWCEFSCFVEGTLIRLADGTDKPVEDITYDDELLVWDFDNGCQASAKPAWIKVEETAPEYLLSRYDNGAELRTVGPIGMHHEVFDNEDQAFKYTDSMVGRQVLTLDGPARCMSCDIIRQEVRHYNIVTERHFNLYANGILTSCRLNKMYDIDDMKYIKERIDAEPVSYDEFDKSLVAALRLDEQPSDLRAYVGRMVRNMKAKA